MVIGHNFAKKSKIMAINISTISKLISDFRALSQKDSISPESLGVLLQRLADLINTAAADGDIADGYTELNNTPRTRRVKTVFFAMRHAIDDMEARNECVEIMRELFRQLMSVLTLERVKLEQNCIYLDPRISFNEIDRYFFGFRAGFLSTGAAGATASRSSSVVMGCASATASSLPIISASWRAASSLRIM